MKINSKIITFLFILVAALYLYYIDMHRKQSLKKTLKTYAIVTTKPYSGARIPLSIKFRYKNKLGQSIIIDRDINESCSNLELGDTIYIRYSTTDNYVAEIIHCFWNDKLREDMNNQSK
jgi:hypothetical protein